MNASKNNASTKSSKKASNGMSPQRIAVVKALKAKSPDTLANLVKRSKLPERAVYHHLWHLRKDGFAKSRDRVVEDGLTELVFELTVKGSKLAV